jgi:hypothetical protein
MGKVKLHIVSLKMLIIILQMEIVLKLLSPQSKLIWKMSLKPSKSKTFILTIKL